MARAKSSVTATPTSNVHSVDKHSMSESASDVVDGSVREGSYVSENDEEVHFKDTSTGKPGKDSRQTPQVSRAYSAAHCFEILS